VTAVVVLTGFVVLRASGQAEKQQAAASTTVPTFTKDVAPILFKNCTGCHRPGEIAPMSLLTYEDARPYARAIFEEVRDGHMPPWHAEAPEGTFTNERRLSAMEKATLLAWADGGAPKGSAADMPAAPTYTDGWQLGTPDKVFEMAEPYEVPATGTVRYEYFYIPTDIKEPTFVKAIEIRPGARSVVHHVLAFYRAKPDMQRSPVLRLNQEQMRTPPDEFGRSPRRPVTDGMTPRLVATYAPGTNPQKMPEGTAIRLEAGGVLELQMHYTATGTATKDRTRVGLFLAKEASPREVRISQFFNAQLKLPAGQPDVAVDADVSFVQDTTLWGLFPHTHLRGKRWRHVLELPDGTKKTILDVPRYDFNWQTYYMFKQPLLIPAGSRLVSTAWYDNSARNPSNPDPKVDVLWGDQTWEEMQYTGLIFSPVAAPKAPGSILFPLLRR
jgi:hypothetical protein